MNTRTEGVRVEYVPLSEIERWPRNPKLHDDVSIRDSIRRFGFIQPLTLDEKTGRLVAGHGRLEALQKMRTAARDFPPERITKTKDGEWMVPVIRGVSFENEQEAEAYLLADNRLVEVGGWDAKALTDILSSLKTDTGDLLKGIGWSSADVEAILLDANAKITGPTPEEREVVYAAGIIKQVVLYFDGKDYDGVLAQLQKIMDADASLKSHTDVFLKLLKHYEASHNARETTGPEKA